MSFSDWIILAVIFFKVIVPVIGLMAFEDEDYAA